MKKLMISWIVQSLEDSSLLIKGVREAIRNEVKEKEIKELTSNEIL